MAALQDDDAVKKVWCCSRTSPLCLEVDPRLGAADDEFVLITIVEIEMNQWRRVGLVVKKC